LISKTFFPVNLWLGPEQNEPGNMLTNDKIMNTNVDQTIGPRSNIGVPNGLRSADITFFHLLWTRAYPRFKKWGTNNGESEERGAEDAKEDGVW